MAIEAAPRRGISQDASREVILTCLLVSFLVPLLATILFPVHFPYRVAFACIIGCLSLLLSIWILFDIKVSLRPKHRIAGPFFMAASCVIAILIVVISLTHRTGFSVLSSGNPAGYLWIYIPTIFLTAVFPGYAILSIFYHDNSFDSSAVAVHSVILSVLISGAIGFVTWNLGAVEQLAPFVLIVLNSFLLICLLYSVRKNSRKIHEHTAVHDDASHTYSLPIMPAAIVTTLLAFIWLSYLSIHNTGSYLLPLQGDEWFHVGYIVKILSNHFSWQETALGSLTMPAYPYFFHLFVATGVSVSGIPIADILLLNALLLLPVPMIAFYMLSKSVTNNQTIPIIATIIFQVFSGFGWIYVLLTTGSGTGASDIWRSSNVTCDIVFSTWLPINVAPYLIDLAIFFVVISMMLKRNVAGVKLISLLTPLLILSLLSHLEKTVILALLVIGISFFQFPLRERKFRTEEFGVALLLSSIAVAAVDILAAKQLFTSIFLSVLIASAAAGFLILVLSAIPAPTFPGFPQLGEFIRSHPRKLLALLGILGMVIGVVELLALTMPGPSCSTIPLYFLPVKLGAAGLLALLGIFGRSKGVYTKSEPLTLLLATVCVWGIIFYHIPITFLYPLRSVIDEFRFIRDVLWPVVAIASGCVLQEAVIKLDYLKPKRLRIKSTRLILCSLIIAILVSVAPISHFLKIEAAASTTGVEENSYELAQFLESLDIPTGSSIYAPTAISSMVNSITGVVVYTPLTSLYGALITNATDPSSVLFALDYLNISYVISLRTESGHNLDIIMDRFQVVYEDQIYQVNALTKIAYPSRFSKTAFLNHGTHPDFSLNSDFILRDDLMNVSEWGIEALYSSNVISCALNRTDESIRITATGIQGSKVIMTIWKELQEHIILDYDASIWIRFKTQEYTRLIVQILYDDGSMKNAFHEGTPYIENSKWTWSATTIEKGPKAIVGFRILITNRGNENIDVLAAELSRIAILSHYEPLSASITYLSIAELDFTVESNSQGNVLYSYDNIIMFDYNLSNETLAHLLELAEHGKRIIVVGGLDESIWISRFVTVTPLNLTSRIGEVIIDGVAHPIPEINIASLDVERETTLAYYSDVIETPLVFEVPLSGTTNMTYINWWPILNPNNEIESDSSISQIHVVVRTLLSELLNLPTVDSQERPLFLKSESGVMLHGNFSFVSESWTFRGSLLPGLQRDYLHCAVNIDGGITLEAHSYGYVLLWVEGQVSILVDDELSYKGIFVRMEVVVRLQQITGVGNIAFASLSSGFPYWPTLQQEPFVASGAANIAVFPISPGVMMIMPSQLAGIGR